MIELIVKCGRVEFELNEKDIVMHNGSCYQIITRSTGYGWNKSTPLIAKNKAIKLIKEGLLKETKLENPPYNEAYITYYSIQSVEKRSGDNE